MSRITGREARSLREAYQQVYGNVNKKKSEELKESFFSWLDEHKDMIPEGVGVDIKELYAVYLIDKGYITEQPVLNPRERSGVGVMRPRTAAPVVRPGQPVAPAPGATRLPPTYPGMYARYTIKEPGAAGTPTAAATPQATAKPAPGTPTAAATPQATAKPAPGAAGTPTAAATPQATAKPMTAMDKWKAANPKLAAAAAERERIRGTAQTDNPLMKDMRSRLSLTPSVQSPTLKKDLGNLAGSYTRLTDNPNAAIAATPKPAATSKTQPTSTQSTSTQSSTTPSKKEPPKKPPLRDEPLF